MSKNNVTELALEFVGKSQFNISQMGRQKMNKRYEPATFHIVKRENQPLTKQCYEWALFSNLESVKVRLKTQ